MAFRTDAISPKSCDFAGHASEDVFTLNVIYRNLKRRERFKY